MAMSKVSDDGRTVTVRVPISIKKRGGRRLVLAPDGTNVPRPAGRRHIDNAMVKVIARAFRWRELLESGQHSTIREIADVENINETYVGRVLRLTLLSPPIVEIVLRGEQPRDLQVETLMNPCPLVWNDQITAFLTKPS
jgi:hypothetical protein